jgi:hypothetical protein
MEVRMKKALLLSLALVFVLAGNSLAITWEYNTVFDQNIFDYNDDWSPISYPNLPPNTPSPGGSDGEACDIEGSKAAADDDYLYFAITSSFGYGATISNNFYETGEFFFGFNGASTTYSIDVQGMLYENTGSPMGIPDLPQSYHDYPTIYAQVGAFAHDPDYSSQLGGVDIKMHDGLTENSTGDTYVWEMRVNKDLLVGVDFASVNTVSVHMTLACGNDVLDHDYDLSVIPEPTTLLLLGMGLLGAGTLRRKIR